MIAIYSDKSIMVVESCVNSFLKHNPNITYDLHYSTAYYGSGVTHSVMIDYKDIPSEAD